MLTIRYMGLEIKKASLRNDIQSKVREDLDQQQREYFLHQQMKTIAEELGDGSAESEAEDMREKGKTKKWSAEVAKTFEKELTKMTRMNPQTTNIQKTVLTSIGQRKYLTETITDWTM